MRSSEVLTSFFPYPTLTTMVLHSGCDCNCSGTPDTQQFFYLYIIKVFNFVYLSV
jgi:hypothetical protein